ncbi:glucokinase [Peristeroidobacter soli]|uniref:glucokinase n=1 Tax=Peristeroidobacter soli TaxID=2497877 RepID=UPI00101C7C70|nr:glucokinase [Peristeroidobacter soli]
MSRTTIPPRMIADIGGTNARFALLDGMQRRDEVVLACADYPDLVSAAEEYLKRVDAKVNGRPLEAALAIAGPVTGDIIRMTNHVWQFSAAHTRQQLQLRRLIVLNDFTALAMAVRHLKGSDLDQIGGGKPQPNAPIAVIGPGTGLGVSGLIPSGQHWIPLQGEGGHVTLSVMNERELAVLQQLQQRFSHVSAERVISGPGLVTLYDALCGVEGVIPEVLTPPEITKRAQEGTCRLCFETVSMFCALLGTMAGNLVLTLGALGGAYIGGGIAPGLGPMFTSSRFRDRFEDKGRFTDYVSRVPTYVIRAELPALLGLASAFTDPGPRLEAD